jgi:hypothetical protein
LLRREPSDSVLVAGRTLIDDLDSLVELIKGEPGGGLVRLRVKGVGTSAGLVLQAADQPNRHRGLVPLDCNRKWKPGSSVHAKDIDMRVNLKALHDLTITKYFNKTLSISNIVLDVLPSSIAFPWPVLRLRHEVEGKGGYTVRVFLIGTP